MSCKNCINFNEHIYCDCDYKEENNDHDFNIGYEMAKEKFAETHIDIGK